MLHGSMSFLVAHFYALCALCSAATASSSSFSAGGITSPSPCLSVPRMAAFNFPYARSRSSLTMMKSCAPVRAYANSEAAMANRRWMDSGVSVPRPSRRVRREEKEGGEMKMNLGCREGCRSLIIWTPCKSGARMDARQLWHFRTSAA